MMRAVMVILFLLFSQTAGASERPPADGRDFMSWRLLEQERVSDGGTTVVYELLWPGDSRDIEQVEIFYAVKPWERQRRSRRIFQGPAKFFTKNLVDGPSAPRLSIYYGGSARIEIAAGALIDGRFHTARTMVNTYGDNGRRNDPEAQPVSSLPRWPGLSLLGAGFYRALTGEPLYFIINADHRGQAVVRAFDRDWEVTAELDDLGNGTYQYIPPLDPVLSAPGYSVKKDVTMVAALADQGGVLSYYIPVNRSYYGNLYLAPGLLVVGLSSLASLGLVKLAGRRFKWR
jgi:hypothetical protein